MNQKITIKEVSLHETVLANALIPEFKKTPIRFFSHRIGRKKYYNLVAYVNGKIAGYNLSYDKYEDGSIYCWMTGVVPKYRRMGILKKMMKKMTTWAKKEGYNSIKLKTRNNRREMLSYAVKNNYNVIEVLPREKFEDNRIIVEKRI